MIEPGTRTDKIRKTLKRIPAVRALARQLGLSRDDGPRTFLLGRFPRGSIGAEIGVHKGDFSEQILRLVRPAKLHLIDPWKYESSDRYRNAYYGGKAKGGQVEMDHRYAEVCDRFRRHINSGRVIVHRACSGDACDSFPDDYFDWVYIDGNHLYEFAKDDLECFYRKVRSGGLITGDDYKTGGWWESGVKLAVDEFLNSRPVQLIEIRNYQFILAKRAS